MAFPLCVSINLTIISEFNYYHSSPSDAHPDLAASSPQSLPLPPHRADSLSQDVAENG